MESHKLSNEELILIICREIKKSGCSTRPKLLMQNIRNSCKKYGKDALPKNEILEFMTSKLLQQLKPRQIGSKDPKSSNVKDLHEKYKNLLKNKHIGLVDPMNAPLKKGEFCGAYVVLSKNIPKIVSQSNKNQLPTNSQPATPPSTGKTFSPPEKQDLSNEATFLPSDLQNQNANINIGAINFERKKKKSAKPSKSKGKSILKGVVENADHKSLDGTTIEISDSPQRIVNTKKTSRKKKAPPSKTPEIPANLPPRGGHRKERSDLYPKTKEDYIKMGFKKEDVEEAIQRAGGNIDLMLNYL